MTKLAIDCEYNDNEETITFEKLSAGVMFYSYNTDSLFMFVELEGSENDVSFINLTTGEMIEFEEGLNAEEAFEALNDSYGNFYIIKKAKIKFKA